MLHSQQFTGETELVKLLVEQKSVVAGANVLLFLTWHWLLQGDRQLEVDLLDQKLGFPFLSEGQTIEGWLLNFRTVRQNELMLFSHYRWLEQSD